MTTTITAHFVATDTGILSDHAVTVDNGMITAIAPATTEPQYELLAPGFVDIQVNGHDDVDVATMTEGDWPRIRQLLTAQGVTAWCPTLITSTQERYGERLAHLQRFAADSHGSRGGPAVLGVHLEGPYLGDRHGAHTNVAEGPIDLDWLAALPDIVKIMTLGPERPNALEATKLLTARGVTVALGHTGASYEQTMRAIDAGARLFTHCFNAAPPLHHREPGAIGAALANDDIAISLILDAIHVHPAVAKIACRAKPTGKTILVTDAAAWRSGRLGGRAVELRDGAPRLADGTLAGSSLTMNRAIETAVDQCGVDLADAIDAASKNPAELLGLANHGVLAVGMPANLVALDNSYEIQNTWLAATPSER